MYICIYIYIYVYMYTMSYVFSYIDISHMHHVYSSHSFVFYNIVEFCWFVHWISSCFNVFFKQRRTPLWIWAGSVPHWGVWLTIVRWVCMENSNTKSPPGVHSPDRGLSEAKPMLCPRGWEATCIFLVGWACLHAWTSTVEWPAKTKAPTLLRTYGLEEVASQARGQSTGFVWQATNRAVDTRRVILCSGSHRTLIAQSWVRPPARNRFSSDPQRSASLPKEHVEIQ